MSVSEKEAEAWIMNEADRAARQCQSQSEWRKQIEDASMQAVQMNPNVAMQVPTYQAMQVPTYQCGSPGVIGSVEAAVQRDTATTCWRVSDANSANEPLELRLRVSSLQEAFRVASEQLMDANRIIAALSAQSNDTLRAKVERLEQELSDERAMTAHWREVAVLHMSDPPQSESPDAAPKRGAVDEVVDALDKRLVGRTDRGRLRGALDKADAPLTGRAAGDEALKRISGLGALQGDRR